MLRARGGRSLTISPPMRIVPEVISSSPAIILSVVDLPQPDGPTSATNSPLAISRSIARTASTAPYRLTSRSRVTVATVSALHRAEGEPGYEPLLDDEGQRKGGRDHHHRERAHAAPVDGELGGEVE